MAPKSTTSFILIVRYFTCRPNHDMGPIFYLRTDARTTRRFLQASNTRPFGLKATTLTTGPREQNRKWKTDESLYKTSCQVMSLYYISIPYYTIKYKVFRATTWSMRIIYKWILYFLTIGTEHKLNP